ncbi:homocysteine S-methyltransferase [Terrihabitans soli]|uniref:Homocysteine S-methyltransferase n=1 Tax=Terrihabitans soli TaxID=708113 RepID=A0A6S6QWD5_9HYPH|nr:homocysteine S-methyltransferase family protein [Terrihabitans soli]BCJ91562.1 homocysteine S-methyltransferase [Terrihabitans soli]
MAKYRQNLPQLGDAVFLTDSGLETTLIFLDGIELPYFASFPLLKTSDGKKRLRDYYDLHAGMAVRGGMGFVLETPTWRCNPDWAQKLGYTLAETDKANRDSVSLMAEVRRDFETPTSPMVISGNIGPRGDGYDPGKIMSSDEAMRYHAPQIASFKAAEADMVSAFTMTNVPEAVGIVRAAKRAGMPVAISFTLETDGKLPGGLTLRDAIELTDAQTSHYAAYYMINCAHPTHFETALKAGEAWTRRIRGLRANASKRSHAELDASPDLDAGNPAELGQQYRDLRRIFRGITIVGGCCGTDHRHVHEIARWCEAVSA